MPARAVVVVLVSAGAAVAAASVWLRTRPEVADVEAATGWSITVGDELIGLLWVLTGGLLAWSRPRNAVGWLLLAMGTCQTLSAALAAYGGLGLVAGASWPAARWSAWVASGLWVPGLLLLATVVPAIYPEGHLPGPRWRWPVGVGVTGILLLTAGALSSQAAYGDVAPGASPWALTLPGWAETTWAVLAGGCFLGGTVAVWVLSAVRLARSRPPERPQLAWLFVVVVLPFLLLAVEVEGPLFAATLCLLPLAIAVGVVRYRLLGIEVMLRRGLVYGTLTAAVAALYVGVTAAASTGLGRGPWPGVLAAAIVAIGLAPARERLLRAVDRLLYGERRDPMRAVRALGQSLREADEPGLLAAVLTGLTRALRAPGAEVLAPDGRLLAVVGTRGSGPPAAGATVPLTVGGVVVGSLVVATRGPRESFTDADLRLLDALTPQVAVVVRALQLAEALEAERDRVVGATRLERERLRRDLHDGLGPSLSGVGLGLQALEDSLAVDRAPPQDLVPTLRAEVGSAVTEVRRIIDDLRPAALDDAGLGNAVRRHAETATGPGVDVAVGELPWLPPEVETAAFRITTEALTNAARHAQARRVSVGLDVSQGTLRVRVSDDGRGFPGTGASGNGVGLASMRHRAEAIGGALDVRSSHGGTTVTATLPLSRP